MKNYLTGDTLKFMKMLVIKFIIVNGMGLVVLPYLGIVIPIWLLAISWCLNIYFIFRMVKSVRQNIMCNREVCNCE